MFNADGGLKGHIKVPGVAQVLSLAWSPDGSQLAVSGMANAWSDLFLYDLKTKQATRLEHDRYAHLQPAWSPDGHTLAFVTDSGPQTNFDLLQFGPMQIALMDMTNPDHPSRLLTTFRRKGKEHQSPVQSRWPDGVLRGRPRRDPGH